jgi:tRNA dimethylallyltransferase
MSGAVSLETVIDQMARATRHFAKRQFTWFRATPGLRWLDTRCTVAEIIDIPAHLGERK